MVTKQDNQDDDEMEMDSFELVSCCSYCSPSQQQQQRGLADRFHTTILHRIRVRFFFTMLFCILITSSSSSSSFFYSY